MASSDEIAASIHALAEEASVLSKVIIRNCNQHGKSKLFGYLRRASKTATGYLSVSDVLALSEKAEQCLRSKTSVRDLHAAAHALQQLRCMLRSSGEVVFCSLKAYALLHQSLRKKLYVPLFSVLLALCARLTIAASGVYQHADRQCSYVASHLRSVVATHRQHAPLLKAVLQTDSSQAAPGATHAPKVSSSTVQQLLQKPQSAWADALSLMEEDIEVLNESSELGTKILPLEASDETFSTAANSSSSSSVTGGTISSENNAKGKLKKYKLSQELVDSSREDVKDKNRKKGKYKSATASVDSPALALHTDVFRGSAAPLSPSTAFKSVKSSKKERKEVETDKPKKKKKKKNPPAAAMDSAIDDIDAIFGV